VHPTFLYECLWNIGVLLFLLWFRKRKKWDGQMLAVYFIGYGSGRFLIEGLRTDSLYFMGTGIRVSQMLALILVVLGIVWMKKNFSKFFVKIFFFVEKKGNIFYFVDNFVKNPFL